MTNEPLIIIGSARKHSDTKKFAKVVFAGIGHTVIDLLDHHVSPYNYSHEYPPDDTFHKAMNELLSHKIIVFATPVYWYAMSGQMKIFFDRLTDLVTAQKHMGRQLKGKSVFLLAVGSDGYLPDGFEVPFRLTADYFGMIYQSAIYYSTGHLQSKNELDNAIISFTGKLSLT